MNEFETDDERAPRSKSGPASPPVEIPASALSPEALQGLLEAFIYREGTDYGAIPASHESKIRDLRSQLENGRIKIIFDPDSESVTLVTEQQWRNFDFPINGRGEE